MESNSFLIALVLLAALLHASWNALVRIGGDRLIVLAAVNFTGTMIGATLIGFLPMPEPAAWPYLALSVVLHSGYYFYLLRAYDRGELIQVYPLARGSAPLLISLGGLVFAGETLGVAGSIGVVLTSLGVIGLAFERGSAWRNGSAVVPALITSIWIAAYSVTDGLGGRLSGNVLSYICWLSFLDGWPIVIYTVIARRHGIIPYLQSNWKPCIGGGILSMSAYGLVIFAMSLGAMGMVSALRETSVIMAAVIGIFWLKEKVSVIRISAILMVVCGVMIMQING
ncbi:MAG: hypothetical protein DHS20C01_17580 [marine bacterium B5-7]|nr:MAG: hypothetical protein DHS20C01_17580 [marine bacterium B5-7]